MAETVPSSSSEWHKNTTTNENNNNNANVDVDIDNDDAADDGNNDGDEENNNDHHHDEDFRPPSKFQPKQRVYAKDEASGLWYEAVVRRSLWGVNHNKQVKIGLVCSEEEIRDILEQAAQTPKWYYFVHYNNWAVNWDRWVAEDEIMETNDESKRIADRYHAEHKALMTEMRQGKKTQGDGAAFLKEWRKRMDNIQEMMKKKEQETGKQIIITNEVQKEVVSVKPVVTPAAVQLPNNKKTMKKAKLGNQKVWDKIALEREYKLRLRGLASKRSAQDQHKVALPFSLKKCMVEAWEIITQCDMVPNLPASVTVRQVLDMYLESKLELIHAAMKTSVDAKKEVPHNNEMCEATIKTADNSTENTTEAEELQQKLEKKKQEWKYMVEGIAMFFDDALPFRLLYCQELPQYKVVESTFVVPISGSSSSNLQDDTTAADVPTKEDGTPVTTKDVSMKDVADAKTEKDGVKIEFPQNESTGPFTENATQKTGKAETEVDAQSSKSGSIRRSKTKAGDGHRPLLPCEVYGCEHLLRLCLKIPDLLAEQQPATLNGTDAERHVLQVYEGECKQILAKVNDLVRFLHKHQSTLFADSYRRINEAEECETQKWARYVERKRKRALEEKQAVKTAEFSVSESCSTPIAGLQPTNTPSNSVTAEKNAHISG